MKILNLIVAAISINFILVNIATSASFKVVDDDGHTVIFNKPAVRIISLSPHATELLFAAGATNQIAATVSYSDYPPQAKNIKRIGSYKKIDLESVVKVNPDLIIAWNSGGNQQQIEDLKKLGYKFYFSEPRSFEDVAANIVNMGVILGTTELANIKAQEYLSELKELKLKYSNLEKVKVFYQVWDKPLRTINDGHLINSVIEFCGGSNVYADLSLRAPKVGIESVIQKNPEAIIIGMSENRKDWIEPWFKWVSIDAVKNKHVYSVDADLIVRQGPRILQGTKLVCELLEKVRNDKN